MQTFKNFNKLFFFLQMNSCIKNPKILLLKCSIEYLYREETKFTCIDPIVLQVRIYY